jgi:hypothetical protein
MRYNLSDERQAGKARTYLASLIKKGATSVEITEKRRRTLTQNGLFHLWVKCFADCIGESSAERCKVWVKRALLGQHEEINPLTNEPELFDYETHLFSVEQMNDLLTKFKAWALTEFECRLPEPDELGFEQMFDTYIE